MALRKKLYLIGNTSSEIKFSAKLPSNREVLAYFMYQHKDLGRTVHESLKSSIDTVSRHWERASIPIREVHHCIKKLRQLFNEWTGLRKHEKRPTEGHRKKENEFSEKMDYIFDIAHANAEKMIKNKEDYQFLLLQRKKGYPGALGLVDKEQQKKSERSAKRLMLEEERRCFGKLNMILIEQFWNRQPTPAVMKD